MTRDKDTRVKFTINMFKWEDFSPFIDEMLSQGVKVTLSLDKEDYVVELEMI